MSSEPPTSIDELAELTADIVADAEKLRDHVTDLENDGMEIRAIVDAADRLFETAGAVARALAALADEFDDWGDPR